MLQSHTRSVLSHFVIVTTAAAAITAVAASDLIWEAAVPPGQVTPTNVRFTVTIPPGISDTDQDQYSPPLSGSMSARLEPSMAPFHSIDITAMEITTTHGYYSFDFFCSFLGCQHVDVHGELTTHTLMAPVHIDLTSLSFSFTAEFLIHFVNSSTGVISGSQDLTGTIPITVSGSIVPGPNGAQLRDITMSEYFFPVPPALLPPGVSAISYIRVLPNEANFMTGGWTVVSPADINGDGGVNGADLAVLLGAWGPNATSPADINDDGAVDGVDLAQVLSNWS